jgi:hypothetical protein
MTDATPKRPMEGWYLRDALAKLAEICAIAGSMRLSLTEPLTEDDIAAGAEPLSPEQIVPDLERIGQLATSLAIEELQASAEEWYAANDKIG